jgi:hypothetical protein
MKNKKNTTVKSRRPGAGRPKGSVSTQNVTLARLNQMFKENAEIPVGSAFVKQFRLQETDREVVTTLTTPVVQPVAAPVAPVAATVAAPAIEPAVTVIGNLE